jgi:endoplasmic reticulum-Golgi intermediate compartment protein 2
LVNTYTVAKTKPTYQVRSSTGGPWTIVLIVVSLWLSFTEIKRWLAGSTTHTFTVEKGISRTLQVNMDYVVAMKCGDLHVNVQDAAGDRILAGEMLQKDPTNWEQQKKIQQRRHSGQKEVGGGEEAIWGEGKEEDVHDYLQAARNRRRYGKTPRIRGEENACRVYGSLQSNKVQGDFHITARGHGYMEFGQHLEHNGK